MQEITKIPRRPMRGSQFKQHGREAYANAGDANAGRRRESSRVDLFRIKARDPALAQVPMKTALALARAA